MEASKVRAPESGGHSLRLWWVGEQSGGMAALQARTAGWVVHAAAPEALLALADDELRARARTAEMVLVAWTETAAAVVPALRRVLARQMIPVFAVCGRNEAEHVAALVLGADAVLVHPVNPILLQARLLAYQRVRQHSAAPVYERHGDGSLDGSAVRPVPEARCPSRVETGPLAIDLNAHLFFANGIRLELTAREFELMAYLMRGAGMCRRRDDILNHVWGIDYDTGTNILDVHVYSLRRKLRRHGAHHVIQTVRGVGYRIAPGAPETPATPAG